MPRKAKHPCHHPGCPNLTEGQYCEQHQKAENKRYEKYDRDPAVRRKYNKLWRRIRQAYILRWPNCQKCMELGKLVPAEEVHHIVPLSEGGTHNFENLISLCKSCHSKIHAERGDRWKGNGSR